MTKRILFVCVVAMVALFFCGSASFAESKADKLAEKFKNHKSYSNVDSDPAYQRAKKELAAVQKIEQIELNALHAKEKTEIAVVHAREMAIFEADWKKGTVDIEALKKDLRAKYQNRIAGVESGSKKAEESVEVPISEKSQKDLEKMIADTKEKARKWLNEKENAAEPVKEEPVKVGSDVQESLDKAREKAREWIETRRAEREKSGL